MTDLQTERDIQASWNARARRVNLTCFNQMVSDEFAAVEFHQRRTAQRIRELLQFALVRVPYYRERLPAMGFRKDQLQTLADLSRLPILGKQDLLDHNLSLRATKLPAGEQLYGIFRSSGTTTGRKTEVLMTASSNLMFSLLMQRHYRVMRLDPQAKMARILSSRDLPRTASGEKNPDGQTLRHDSWRYVGSFFNTGPEVNFNRGNPITLQLQWLAEEQPDYLVANSGNLEHLAHAASTDKPSPISLQVVLGSGEQMTPAMAHRITGAFGARIEQGYGLNEIGLVAVRCTAGRYHVHTEHCWVEIVDEDGAPCHAGDTGRVIVTALRNPAMPLFRYETGDLARAVAGDCPCGRTLPGFGTLIGRYRRHAYLPENSMQYYRSLLQAFADMPLALCAPLRHYQLHQYRDNTFEFRYAAVSALPQAFFERLRQAWELVAPGAPLPLQFKAVETLAVTGRKLQVFTSDFAPELDHTEPVRSPDPLAGKNPRQ